MDEFCKEIGIIVITAVMFAVPILFTCSIALRWDARMIMTLALPTAIDFVIALGCIYTVINEHS